MEEKVEHTKELVRDTLRNYQKVAVACSSPGGELERDCSWENTSKCGGECGIHTQQLK